MGNWSKLKADEKVRVIKFARLNGVSNISDIRDTFNMYMDKLQNSAENYYNGVVYSIMSLRPGTDRSFADIGEALLHPNKKGMYSGNIGEEGWPNWDRDLLKLYLNKDTTGFTEIDPQDSEYKGSYNYNTNDSSIKSYKGDLIIGHEPNVSPAIYQLAKDMAKDNIKILRNMDKDIVFNYNDYKLNRDRGVREEDWYYHMQPGEFVDDVRRYKRNYTLSNDEPIIQASKMWDFTPHNNMGLMEKIKSSMLSSAGSPFILRDAQKLLLSNSDDLYTRVLNTSILEDALDNNVMIKNQDNTLSPLTIFPEIFVHPKSQDWDYYLPSSNIPKDELPTLTDDAVISIDPTYKTVVNDIFKDTPFVGHYININNMDAYPYTGYKTLHDEATRTSYNDGGPLTHQKSTGGPLYPFSFEKIPFLKTPIVRYDEGGEITNINLPEFTVMPRDSFVTYTGEETIAPTLGLFIKSKQDEARVLAGHKMLNIEKPVMPIIPSLSLWSKAMGYLGMSDLERINRYGICLDPETCIYTATSMYPKQNRVSGTETFADNSLNYGFIPVQNGVFGDIGLFDGHGTMITGFNNKSQPVLSYSRGGLDASHILIDNDNWENSQGDHYLGGMGPMTSYRFVGTPEQQREWANLYNTLYSR